MSVILEFSIGGGEFQLGQVLSGPPDMHLEVERIVPTGTTIMPFVWATGDDHPAFEERVRSHPAVGEFIVLDTVGDSRLYRIEWNGAPTDLIEGITRTDAAVLQASGNGDWLFRLRFPDHGTLSQFHDYVVDHGVPIHVERTYTPTGTGGDDDLLGLSVEQREALLLALRRGYFETPSEATLDELAGELGITRQALSNRIRRGTETILRTVLLAPGED